MPLTEDQIVATLREAADGLATGKILWGRHAYKTPDFFGNDRYCAIGACQEVSGTNEIECAIEDAIRETYWIQHDWDHDICDLIEFNDKIAETPQDVALLLHMLANDIEAVQHAR